MKLKRFICGFLFSIICFFTVCMLNKVSNAEGKSITLDYSTFDLTGSYSKKSETTTGFDFIVDSAMKGDSNSIQMNSSKGSHILYNTKTIGDILSVELDYKTSNKSAKFSFLYGTDSSTSKSKIYSGTHAYGSKVTIDLSDDLDSIGFMKIDVTNSAHYFKSIKITYTEAATSYDVKFFDGSTEYTELATKVEEGKLITAPADPEAIEGFIFEGWYKEPSCTNKWDFTKDTVTEAVNLYAKFIIDNVTKYDVTFETNGGSVIEPVQVIEGNQVNKPENPTKENYVFAGWYIDEALTTKFDFSTSINAATTIYAKWNDTYTVTFNTDNGTSVPAQQIENGKLATKPADPKKTGFRFAGWYTDASFKTAFDFNTPITKDTEIFAKFTDNSIVELDGLTFNQINDLESFTSGLYVIGAQSKDNEPVFMSNTFDSKNRIEAKTVADAYYYIEKIETGYIIYSLDGKTLRLNGQDVVFDYKGAIFTAKYADSKFELTSGKYTLQKNSSDMFFRGYDSNQVKLSLYKSTTVPTTVTYMTSDGVYAKQVITASTTTAPTTPPTKSNLAFEAWTTDVEGENVFDFTQEVTESITLYAKFSSDATKVFETLHTEAGLQFHYSVVDGVATVDNIKLRLGIENMSENAYHSEATYGILLVQKSKLVDDKNQTISFNTLLNQYAYGKTIDELVKALSAYDVKNYELKPAAVENGYNFASVFTGMDEFTDVEVSAVCYMVVDGQVFFMDNRTVSVQSLAKQYVATGEYTGDVLLALQALANGGNK